MPLINIILSVLVVQALRYLIFDHGVFEFIWKRFRNVPVLKTFLSCAFCQGFWLGTGVFIFQVQLLLALGWGLVSGFISASWSKWSSKKPEEGQPSAGSKAFTSKLVAAKNCENDYQDEICLLECNIDDMSGEFFGDIMERLFIAGAVDVWFTSAYGKKNRPLYQLSALFMPEDEEKGIEQILRHTSTAGIRHSIVRRTVMDRTFIKVKIEGELIAVKKLTWKDVVKFTPEWEDCVKVSKALSMPVAEIYSLAQSNAKRNMEN